MPRHVDFPSKGINIAGELYLPERRRLIASLHVKLLSGKGFIALAFDAAHQGESGGKPRGLEDPTQRAEDVRIAVTYLITLEGVDPERIRALEVCASGGYVPCAAQTDVRVKAVATLSGADVGFLSEKKARVARTAEAKGEKVERQPIVPDNTVGIPDTVPVLFREGSD